MLKTILFVILLPLILLSNEWPQDLADFSAWRADLGEWFEAGGVYMNPDEPTQLGALPGEGVFINGVKGRTRHLVTKQAFADAHLHVEFLVPQNSNSGVYLMGRYEIQVWDSYKSAYSRDPVDAIQSRATRSFAMTHRLTM